MPVFVSGFEIALVPVLSSIRRLLKVPKLLLISSLLMSLWLSFPATAWANDTPVELFEVHCAGCHPNGANIIRRGKNLKQRALKRNGYGSAEAIATLITNGKGLMSAYGDQLSQEEINSLADYVLEQAAINWQPAK